MRRLLVPILALALSGCDDRDDDPRTAQIVSVLASADEAQIRTRPALVAGKYARMALAPFDYYRGSLPVFRNDVRSGTTALGRSRFALDVPLVPSHGDPHPENFGVLRAGDGSLALEPNDFDAADAAPYLWDVRRLTAGVALAARASNADDPAARERAIGARRAIARKAAEGYRLGIEGAAAGAPPIRVDESLGGPIVADVFSRSRRDANARAELRDRTRLEPAARRLVRGVVDAEDPQNVYADLPPTLAASLPDALAQYRLSLVAPPPPETFQILDAVREFGSGVASWPRVRVIVLVRGATDAPDDDLLLELKELADSPIAGHYLPFVHHDAVGARVVDSARLAWARPDAEPYWGRTEWLGFPIQVRLETEGQKGIRVERMVEERGTPEALEALALTLGRIVARMHASGPDGLAHARAIFARIALDPEGFTDEQAEAGVTYADLTAEDHARFARAVVRYGLRLGVPTDPADAPRPDLANLFGTPPSPPALP